MYTVKILYESCVQKRCYKRIKKLKGGKKKVLNNTLISGGICQCVDSSTACLVFFLNGIEAAVDYRVQYDHFITLVS